MHTEHLQSVRIAVVALAWFIGVCVASAIMLVVIALDLVVTDSTTANRLELVAVAVGFFTGGLYAGLRVREAPILHGISIALFSMVVWFVFNVLSALLSPSSEWAALTPDFTLALMLLQIATAVLGARLGYRMAVRGTSTTL